MVCTCLGTSTTPGPWLVCKLKNLPHSVALHLRETLDACFFFKKKGCRVIGLPKTWSAFSHLKMVGPLEKEIPNLETRIFRGENVCFS